MAIDEKKLIDELNECGREMYLKVCNPVEYCEGFYAGMTKALDIIEAQPKLSLENKTSDWIPCSERLPEVWKSVLVTSGHLRVRDIRIAFVNENMEWCSIWNSCEPDILAWMPLPEPYKGEENV